MFLQENMDIKDGVTTSLKEQLRSPDEGPIRRPERGE
jgi:hypothetical protein